ncbi:hypothetical protein SARC_06521 [Sphaeroforma arctica JP610]|uniref:Uncharacterized protein n=1 Tax=Sphaeroforma arctica JP610 TaxID=667725 RepID=A0A0L0FWY4_9EUKA|nr:hypothetical protein SARC_06521 [Sphaeroforma arctica JP610]KNC81139.1 hypothetical protein SARC_06521 [Sphaeroforma arctica JP610]|eukprot:XP_014155041.1 hypothetical protein SARC_06521 [Sphaeroforma arctica JP610]
MTKRKGKAKASKSQPTVTPLEHLWTPDPQADDNVAIMMAHALPKDVFDDVTMGKPLKSKKSKKIKEKKGEKVPRWIRRKTRQSNRNSRNQNRRAQRHKVKRLRIPGIHGSEENRQRKFTKLASAFQVYKDRKKTGKKNQGGREVEEFLR